MLMKNMPSKIRRLFNSDRDDIMEISRHIWDGHDYLLCVADKWLQDQNCHFYGVEVDGHVVAVGNLRLIEDGKTGWMEGLRVHPKHRGKGLANEITQYLVRKAEHLGVQRLRYTTANRNKASLKLAKMAGFSKMVEMAVFWHLNPEQLPSIKSYPTIEKSNPTRVYSLLRANSTIVPDGVLFYDWKASDVSLPNLEEIGKTHEFDIALRRKKLDSLSFGYPRPQPEQTWWSFTIYAADSDGFLSQLSHNLKRTSELGFKPIVCTFETRFEKELKEVPWISKEHWRTRLVLLEKQMHKPVGKDGKSRTGKSGKGK
jgi:N-acetylglutamate synthase-like GNAT family acetyltransferase